MPYSSFYNPRKPMKPRAKPISKGDTARRRQHRARLQEARKQRPPRYTELAKTLESLTARYVKMRDGHRCLQCAFDGVESYGVIDAGHLYPKSKFPAAKFDPANIFGQCRGHNTRHIAQEQFMFEWYRATHSPEEQDALHYRATGPKPTRDDLLRMIDEREKQIAEFELMMVA